MQFDFLDRSDRNKFEIFKTQAGGGRHPPKNPKISISRQLFERSAQNLARLRIMAFRTGPALKIKDGGRTPS